MSTLYLEQRIAIVRRALNEKTPAFWAHLRLEDRLNFQQLVSDMLDVLDGFAENGSVERLTKDCP